MEHQGRVVRGAQVAGAGRQHGAEVDHVDVAREVLVDRGEGVVEGVALVVRRFVDQSVHWVELGVAEGVAKEAGVARRRVGLNLFKDIMLKLSQNTSQM